MSVEAQGVEAQVYEELAARAQKHFGSTALGKIVRIADYDPERETHNFDNVFFDARPNGLTPLLLTALATGVSGKSPRAVNRRIVDPFEPQIDEIVERMEARKLMVITGHQTLFEPAFAALGLQRAIARRTGHSYADVAQMTHIMAARALATVDVLGRWPLTSVGRQLTNIYYTFPSSQNYRGDDSMPLEFQRANNARMLAEFAENTDMTGVLGVLSGSATNEKKNEAGIYEIPRIKGDETHGTMGVLMQGWDVLPVGGIYKHDLIVEPGRIIPAEDVTPDIIHAAMADVVVASRNRHGVQAVYAEA